MAQMGGRLRVNWLTSIPHPATHSFPSKRFPFLQKARLRKELVENVVLVCTPYVSSDRSGMREGFVDGFCVGRQVATKHDLTTAGFTDEL